MELADPWVESPKGDCLPAVEPERINSKAAAQVLGVTEAHLRQLVKRGHLSRVGKDGKRATFLRADVLDLRDTRKLSVSRVHTPSEQYDDPK